MIPAWLITRFGPDVAAMIVKIVAVILLVALVVGGYFAWKAHVTAGLETQVKVGTAQAAASQASGTDAVNTVGNVMQNEQAVDAATRTNADVIQAAPGATVAVDPAVRAAGLRALCGRTSYRTSHPACVQHATP